MKRPVEAAHVIGNLLLAGSFRIPPALSEEYGYPELTPAIKEKILGVNAAAIYDIDLAAAVEAARHDDLAWTKEALAEFSAQS